MSNNSLKYLAAAGLSLLFLLRSNDNIAQAEPQVLSQDTVKQKAAEAFRLKPVSLAPLTSYAPETLFAKRTPAGTQANHNVTLSRVHMRRGAILKPAIESNTNYGLKIYNGNTVNLVLTGHFTKKYVERLNKKWMENGTVDFHALINNMSTTNLKQSLGGGEIEYSKSINGSKLHITDKDGNYFGASGFFSSSDIAELFKIANSKKDFTIFDFPIPNILSLGSGSKINRFTLGNDKAKKFAAYNWHDVHGIEIVDLKTPNAPHIVVFNPNTMEAFRIALERAGFLENINEAQPAPGLSR